MQTNDQGPPSTAQEKPSEAAGGSVRKLKLQWAAQEAKRITHWAMNRYALTNGDYLYIEIRDALKRAACWQQELTDE